MRFGKLRCLFLVIVAAAAGCSTAPSARNVQLSGQITDQQGRPVQGLPIYFAVIKQRPGVPAVGEHGTVVTDAEGQYRIRVRELYEAIELSEDRVPYRCGSPIARVSAEAFRSAKQVTLNFVCPRAANNSSKPTPLRGAA